MRSWWTRKATSSATLRGRSSRFGRTARSRRSPAFWLESAGVPAIPDDARRAKHQGMVTLAVDINAAGTVADVRVVRSLGLGLDEKAMEAVRKWRFRPGMKNGSAVAVETQVSVSFRLL